MSTRGKKVTSATTGFAVWLLTTPDIYGLGTANGVSCLNTQTLSFKDFGWHNILKDKQINGICEGKAETS